MSIVYNLQNMSYGILEQEDFFNISIEAIHQQGEKFLTFLFIFLILKYKDYKLITNIWQSQKDHIELLQSTIQ